MTLIGMTLDDARKVLDGKDIVVIENTSDKCKLSDSVLVTNAVLRDGVYYLTVSPFLINI